MLRAAATSASYDELYRNLTNGALKNFAFSWKPAMDAHKRIQLRHVGKVQHFKLVFAGRLTPCPIGKMYIFACRVSNIPLFFVPDDDVMSPAWHVQCSSDAAEINCDVKTRNLTV